MKEARKKISGFLFNPAGLILPQLVNSTCYEFLKKIHPNYNGDRAIETFEIIRLGQGTKDYQHLLFEYRSEFLNGPKCYY